MNPTQRTYTDTETGDKFRLYMNSKGNKFALISDESQEPDAPAKGTEVNGFYLCAFTGITIKINGSKQVEMARGEFYNLKEGETVTHKKFTGFDLKFKKA